MLLESGANINALDHDSNTCIMMAAALGQARVLETLCSAPSADLDIQVLFRLSFFLIPCMPAYYSAKMEMCLFIKHSSLETVLV